MFTGHSVLSFAWALSTGARPNSRHFARRQLERVMEKLLVHATTVGTAGKQLMIHELPRTADAEALAIGGIIAML
jgi:hypothetical protein